MRVVDRKTFLTLPAGTIYCKGVQWAFDSLCIKDDSLENDWIYLDPAWPSAEDSGAATDILEHSLETGSSFPGEDSFGRDGCFDDKDIFLIFEEPDLEKLRGFIDRAIAVGQAAMSEWQPIETAPKNHTDVLLYNDLNKTCVVACWGDINAADSEYGTVVHEENWGWLISDGHNDPISYRAWPYVTHWRPLPAPPVSAERE